MEEEHKWLLEPNAKFGPKGIDENKNEHSYL